MDRRKLKLTGGKTEIAVIRGNQRNVFIENFDVMSFENAQLATHKSATNPGDVLKSPLGF